MARNKFPEVTRARILDTAMNLFLDKGWEETTIQDIIDELGDVTRGAFYHYFKSKDDIIDEVSGRMISTNFLQISAANRGRTGLEKLRFLILASFQNAEQISLAKAAPSIVKSSVFIGKKATESVKNMAPLVRQYLEEGNMDGSISVENIPETAETFVLLTSLWLDPFIFTQSKEQYLQKIKHFKHVYKNIGLPVVNLELQEILMQYYCGATGCEED